MASVQKVRRGVRREAKEQNHSMKLKRSARRQLVTRTKNMIHRGSYGGLCDIVHNDKEQDQLLSAQLKRFHLDEEAYEHALKLFVAEYVVRLQKQFVMKQPIIAAQHIVNLFSNVQDISDITHAMGEELHNIRSSYLGHSINTIEFATQTVQAIAKNIPFLHCYGLYLANLSRAKFLYTELYKQHGKLRNFVDVEERISSYLLSDLLMLPSIRLEQYRGFLRNVEHYASAIPRGDARFQELTSFVKDIRAKLDEAVQSIEKLSLNIESRMRIPYIQEYIFGGRVHLATPQRLFIKAGMLTKIHQRTHTWRKDCRTYVMFLFNDVLLYGVPKGKRCTLKGVWNLGRVQIVNGPNIVYENRYLFTVKPYQSDRKPMTLAASSLEDKESWIQVITQTANMLLRNRKLGIIQHQSHEAHTELQRTSCPRIRVKGAHGVQWWTQVDTNVGMTFFYKKKSGLTSLAVIDRQGKVYAGMLDTKTCSQCKRRAMVSFDDDKCIQHTSKTASHVVLENHRYLGMDKQREIDRLPHRHVSGVGSESLRIMEDTLTSDDISFEDSLPSPPSEPSMTNSEAGSKNKVSQTPTKNSNTSNMKTEQWIRDTLVANPPQLAL